MSRTSIGQLIVFALIIALMLYRNLRPREITVRRLWLGPLTVTALLLYGLYRLPEAATPWSFRLAAGATGAIVGAAVGFLRGNATPVSLGERPGTVRIEPSMSVVLLWAVVLAAKYAVRFLSFKADGRIGAMTDGFVFFALAITLVRTWIVFRKYQLLLRTSGPNNR